MDKIKIGLIQMSCSASRFENLDKAVCRIRQAAKQGAKIICLQELFGTLYFCQTENHKNFSLAEKVPGPSTAIFSKLAKVLKCVLIIPSFEKTSNGIFYNTAVVIDSDGVLIGKYRKMHIPEDPGFYEKYYFRPGNLGFPVFKTRFGKIGVLICWDQWFPEAARILALKGAQIIFYPTAIGWKPELPKAMADYRDAWLKIQQSHAIANGVYVASVNRVGREERLQFWGSSFVADPFGRMIAQAGQDRENNLITVCDFSKIKKIRSEWPFFRDRRVESYGKILAYRTTSRGRR